jgi:DtxR family transcriptional regulator, Mn-dependent transcriptional regulator
MPPTTSPAAEDYLKALCLLEWEARASSAPAEPPAEEQAKGQHEAPAEPPAEEQAKGQHETPAEPPAEEQREAPAEPPAEEQHEDMPTTRAVADRLGVSGASATNMLKRLATIGLVRHVPFKGVTLTPAGRTIAVEVIRHHRLLETYLAEALGVPWDRVHEEAEVLEHVLSEDLENRIAALLGEPTRDPHGHPIPGRSGNVATPSVIPLTELRPGDRATVLQVSDHDPELLRYLDGLGLRPGVEVTGVGAEPFEGTVSVRLGEARRTLGRAAAEQVFVGGRRERSPAGDVEAVAL